MKKITENNFETNIDRPEEIVKMLESGKISLDETILLFKEGMDLVKKCKNKLDKAEKQVYTLLKTEDGFEEKTGI